MTFTRETPDDLARAVLAALESRDVNALRALALSETEFRDHIWPELPAARPERNLPFSYVWGDLRQKSAQHLRRLVAVHGGQRRELVRIEHGPTTRHASYVVHRKPIVTVRGRDGVEQALRLFGSIVEQRGRYKVFSYIADD